MSLRLLRRVARLVREQADREEHARLIASLVALDHATPGKARGLMATQSIRHLRETLTDDPLERLWSLPAWSGGPPER
ncbi:MAG: hypothetical protein JO363_03665 [Solirubrobacterales bacterium]|nr:hypothetical protein [Solirubrobacterales bacterium]